MAVITTYKCDKCGKEWIPGERSVVVGIVVAWNKTTLYSYEKLYPDMQAMWCETCVRNSGILEPSTTTKNPEPIKLSFEEKVIMLLEELNFKREEE